MTTQVEYTSNIDYCATYGRLSESPFAFEKSRTGVLTVYIGRGTVNLFPYGKIQVTAANARAKRSILSQVTPYLVPVDGEKLAVRPYRVHFHSSWPPPEEFEFSACKRVFRYRALKESLPLAFTIVTIMAIFGFFALQGVSEQVLPRIANQTGLSVEVMKVMIQVNPYLILAVACSLPILLLCKRALRRSINLLSILFKTR